MIELKHLGLEHQAFDLSTGSLAVEGVSDDGAVESVCAVHSNLVGSSRLRDELQSSHLPSVAVFYA